MRICSKCGMASDAAVCPNCGSTQFSIIGAQNNQAYKPNNNGRPPVNNYAQPAYQQQPVYQQRPQQVVYQPKQPNRLIAEY